MNHPRLEPVGPWEEVTPGAPPAPLTRRGHLVRRLIPPVVVAVLVWLLGAHELALVIAVLGSVVGLAALRWPTVARGLDHVVHWIGHAVGRVLTLVLLGLFELFVVAPVSGAAWLLRRDPLASRPTPRPPGGWRPRRNDEPDLSPRAFGYEPVAERGRAARVLGRVPRVVGWVVLVVMLDLAVGAAVRSDGAATPMTEQIERATADAPWFDEYVDELESLDYEPDAFLASMPVDHDGRYVNVEAGLRRTVLPAGVPADAPVVWIFGGSSAWGEGQRDEATVASALAALAADAGTPVQVVNRAQRGDSAYVAAQRFERALAHEAAPALAVFLDGPDDVAIQTEHVTGHPSQYGLDAAEEAVRRDDRTLIERYEDTSAVFALGQRIRGLVAATPAWAAAGADASAGTASATVDEIAGAAASVYLRGRDLADLVARQHAVAVRHYWLPTAASSDPGSTYARAAERLDGDVSVLPTLDESEGPVFLDAVHTTEAGARQVAVALFEDLRAAFAADPGG